MATITATSTNNWASAFPSTPTAADDVVIPATFTVTIPTATTVVCRSLTTTGTGSLTFASATAALNIGDATAGSGNVALSISATSAITLTGLGTINFISTSTTQQSITTNGKVMPNAVFNGAGGKWQLQDTWTGATGSSMTSTNGEFYGNAQTINVGKFTVSNNANTKVVDITNCSVNLSGLLVGGWVIDVATNLTVTATGSTITIDTASNSQLFQDRRAATQVYGSIVLNKTNSNSVGLNVVNGTKSCVNLTINSSSYANVSSTVLISTGMTVSGTLTITGNSASNRLLIQSANGSNAATLGTPATITAAVVSLSYVDFIDVVAAGAAIPFTGTSLGDCGGNTSITFTTAVTRYAVAAGSWNSTGVWATSSGGAPGASVPLPQDTVILDASSGAGTYTMNMPRSGKDLTCTGFTRTLNIGLATWIFGSLTLGSGMTFTGNFTFQLTGRGSHAITSNGKSFPGALRVADPGGTYTLQDDLSVPINLVSADYGTFDANGFNVTTTLFQGGVLGVGTTNMGSGTWTLTSTAASAIWTVVSTSTLNASTSSIVISVASANARTFAGGNKTYGTLTYTVANSPGQLLVTGTNTFVTLNVGQGRSLNMPSSTTNTFTNFNVNGAVNGHTYLPGVAGNYLSSPDSTALDIVGDITLVAKIAPTDWTPAANSVIMGKWTVAPQWSYLLVLETGGTLRFNWSADGSSIGTATSTAATGFTDGAEHWVAVTFDVNNGAGGKTAEFWTSTDGVAWTQLGSTVTTASTTSILSGTSTFEIGSNTSGTGGVFTGSIYNIQVWSGLRNLNAATGGTLAFDADLTVKTVGANTFTESSSNGATVTVNGVTAQQGDGRVTLLSSTGGVAAALSKSSGTVSCAYLSIKDSTATGGADWSIDINSIDNGNNTGWIFIGRWKPSVVIS